MNHRYKLALAAGAITGALLSGCGGGGGDSESGSGGNGTAPIASTPTPMSLPLRAAFRARATVGASDDFVISGTCTGTVTIATAAATPATFEGVAGVAVVQTTRLHGLGSTGCASYRTPGTITTTLYYDSNYALLGNSAPGGEYARFTAVPAPLPASVRPGDGAQLATLTLYANSTKTVVTGQRVYSYVVEAETISSVIVKLIARDYDAASQLTITSQFNYRLATDGTLTTLSASLDDRTGSTHVVFTKS